MKIKSISCLYCSSWFENSHPSPKTGRCPNCGGSLKVQHVQTPPKTEPHPYIPNAQIAYKPSGIKRVRVYTYSKFGWKAVKIASILLSLIVVINAIYWLIFYKSDSSGLENPENRNIIPTLSSPIPTQATSSKEIWNDHDWVSLVDSMSLREQENVINLAFISEGGSVKYSADNSLVLSDSWSVFENFDLPYVQGIRVEDTYIQLQINGKEVFLNTYQPFVYSQRPNTVIIVDETGSIWTNQIEESMLTSIDEAVAQLPIIIYPNPNLSTSH